MSASVAKKHLEGHEWRVRFGFWDELDALYNSFEPPRKPRLPAQPYDSAAEWAKRIVPLEPREVLGNSTAVQFLEGITSREAAATNFIISGGPCTGKRSFVDLLEHSIQQLDFQNPCRFACVDASKIECAINLFPQHGPVHLKAAITRVDKDRSHGGASTLSFLVMERFESVAPSFQQHFLLPEVITANSKHVFVILLTRPDASKVPEQLRQLCSSVHLNPLKPMDVRTKLLTICSRERIGYRREGLEELARQSDFKLAASLSRLLQAFTSHQFLTVENVRKLPPPVKPSIVRRVSGVSTVSASQAQPESASDKLPSPQPRLLSSPLVPPPFPLSITKMSEPLRRCPKCTLLPPCSHNSLAKMHERIERTRKLYPNATKVGIVDTSSIPMCPSFLKRGVCGNIQSIGRCRFSHPLDLHEIDKSGLAPRCAVHTLLLPCMHCANVSKLKALVKQEGNAIVELERQVQRARKEVADLDTERYLFTREHGKTVKWGNAKREIEERRSALDSRFQTAKSSMAKMIAELGDRRTHFAKLREDLEHGRSKGTGKGKGRADFTIAS